MKYIRTEDGIYKITDAKSILIDSAAFGISDYGGYINWKKILEKGDKIEELCDEFILFDKDNLVYIPIAIDFDSKEYIFKYANEDYIKMTKIADTDEIYGAIWTDKGLIFVAKMNSEGELELI